MNNLDRLFKLWQSEKQRHANGLGSWHRVNEAANAYFDAVKKNPTKRV